MRKIFLFLSLTAIYSAYSQNTRSLDVRFTNSYAEIPHSASLDLSTGDFTFEAWIKASSRPQSWQAILSNRQVTDTGFVFGLFWDYLSLSIDGFLGGGAYNIDLGDNIWHHVAVTNYIGHYIYYVDGQPEGTSNGIKDISTPNQIRIGHDDAGGSINKFVGLIDEVRIWNRALSQNEIQTNMSECISGNQTGLLTYWRFNELNGSTIIDWTRNGNNGTLKGAASRSIYVPFDCQTDFVVNGNVYGDINSNCSNDSNDISHNGLLIKADPGPFYGWLEGGSYSINLPDSGSYSISIVTQDTIWKTSCNSTYNVQLTGTSDTVDGIDFAMQAAHYCHRLSVDIGAPRLRCCASNTYTFTYRNSGTLPASNAYIEVDFGENLQPQSSTIPWSTVSGNVYTFPIGTININEQGLFNVTVLLDCAAPINSTQCVTAHIYPDAPCVPIASADSSATTITGACINDSLVCFTIRNRGPLGSGDMSSPAPWRLYANDTLITQGTYQLAGGDSLINCYPANGKTYRFETDHPHPRITRPRAIVEACGTNANGGVSFGFVNTVVQDDAELFIDILCLPVICSFDPNDKQVFPTGITANKYIKPEDELEYLIRFQNTGNDTAFKVVIRDTIQTDVIDIATLTSGASSHDYTFNIYGQGIAEWTFDNILLPDSFVNEPGSNGFVKFKAKLLPNIAPGTIVTNSADIYFDFNAPVITNEVWNTVFDTVLRGRVVITGTVLTETGEPVPGVTVKLSDAATDSTVTAADGLYQFEVESGVNYTITLLKNNDAVPANGITTYDILAMRRHLLGMGALPSSYKIISAAEVNAEGDTAVSTQDIVFIRSLILDNISSFPGNRLWQFVSSEYLFPDLSHPFPFNKSRTYTNIISNQSNQNFIGIKLGDVNESWEE